MKYSFANDYAEGCHPSILNALIENNIKQQPGYGDDEYTQDAINRIKKLVKNDSVNVHFVAGGTLANLVVIGSILKPFESVVAADTGHIFTNEAGAIEATGHKVEVAHSKDGKLRPEDILLFLNKPRGYHAVRTRAVYISNTTELGTVYKKKELEELYNFCKANDLILFMDGARLPMALTSSINDLTLADIASLTDIFYLGGTKCGALLGEAIIIVNDTLKNDFKYHLKQRGALMAKGRTISIQFNELLRNNLIFDLANHANILAEELSQAFERKGYSLLIPTASNQIFPILHNDLINELEKEFSFLTWSIIDKNYSAIRLITSWATPKDAVIQFIDILDNI